MNIRQKLFGRAEAPPDFSWVTRDDSAAATINRLHAEGRGNEVTDALHDQLAWEIEYADRNRRASAGRQAHDYCHGTDCISCGCSASGPCISHRALKPPVSPDEGRPARMEHGAAEQDVLDAIAMRLLDEARPTPFYQIRLDQTSALVRSPERAGWWSAQVWAFTDCMAEGIGPTIAEACDDARAKLRP